MFKTESVWVCMCGHSKHRRVGSEKPPLCDSTHNKLQKLSSDNANSNNSATFNTVVAATGAAVASPELSDSHHAAAAPVVDASVDVGAA